MTLLQCPACNGTAVETLGSVGPVPVLCGSVWDSREEAVATPSGTLDLAACDGCGHVWNSSFKPSLVEYDAQYDNALDFSPTFRSFAESLAERLVGRFDLHGRAVAEIGSGKGEFLRQLRAAGVGSGVGYDPTYEGPARDGGIEFVTELFTPETTVTSADFVCCRHVLEHLVDPHQFLLDVRAAVTGEPVPMYFEVPNGEFNFSESGPWDLIYPHVSYFSERSLHELLKRSGFEVLRLERTFGGQFLGADVVATGRLRSDRASSSGAAAPYLDAFRHQVAQVEKWRQRVDALSRDGQVAVWGAGSKGVTFLCLVDPSHGVRSVVDVNPRKWGRYLPGCAREIVSPNQLAGQDVGVVLVMNPAYEREIQDAVAGVGSEARVMVV